MGLALDHAIVISLFLETIIYGICLTLSAITTIVFWRIRAEGGTINRRILGVLLVMVLTATAHVTLSFARVVIAYCVIPGTPDGPVNFFANIRSPTFIGRDVVLITQTLWGDCMNIWRCFVVYNRSKVVIAMPLMIMLAGLIIGSLAIATLPHAPEGSSIYASPGRWIKAYDVLMMCTSLYCTVAISWKLYSSVSRKSTGGRLFPVLLAIIETSAVYTACLLIYLIMFWANSNTQFILIGIIPSLVPSLFCLLILQVKYHRSGSDADETNFPSHRSVEHSSGTSGIPGVRRALDQGRVRCGRGRAMSPSCRLPTVMPIQISTETEVHFSSGGDNASMYNLKKESAVVGEDEDETL